MPEPGPSEPAPERDRPPRPAPPGIGARAAAAAGSFLDYLDARLRLLGLEAREARGAVIRRAVAATIGAVFLLIGYLGLLAGGGVWLSQFTGRPWHLVAIAVGGAHLLIGWFCLIYAKRQLRRAAFRDTRRELEKDREWLNSMRPPKQPPS